MTFENIAPQHLAGAWGFVEHGLQVIQRRVGKTNWTTEQIRNCILGGRAGLFVHAEGFVILEPDHEALSCKPFLNVWLMYFKPGKAKALRPELVAWLDERALQMVGTNDWRFSSPRIGWKGIEPDCEIHMVTWRRKQ